MKIRSALVTAAFVLAICLVTLPVLSVAQDPDSFLKQAPTGYVSDFANILSAEKKGALESLIAVIDKKTTNQIALVTIPTLGDYSIEEYAVKLFEAWKPGIKGKDNGVLIILALRERKIRIEVGYGLEGEIPDSVANRIIMTDAYPFLHQDRFDDGLGVIVYKIGEIMAKSAEADFNGWVSESQYSPPSGSDTTGDYTKTKPMSKFFLFIIGVIIFIIIFSSGRGGLLPWLFLGAVTNNYRGKSGFFRGGGWGGGSSGGGGFGGFGGGSSGGGGASGGF